MPRRTRRLFRKRWILFGFLACIGAAYAASRHPFARQRAHELVSNAIQRELGLQAELGPVELQFPLSLRAGDIRLVHPEHGLLAEARSLTVEPSLTGLLLGRVELKQLRIEGARVRLQVQDGRIVNLPPIALSEDSEDARIPLERLVVERAQLVVESPPHLHASLDRVSAAVDIVEGHRIHVRVSARRGRFRHVMGEESLERLRLSARVTPSRVEIDDLLLDTSLGHLRVKESQADLPLDHGRYRLNLDLSSDITRLSRLPTALELPDLRGKLAVDGSIEGVSDSVRGDLHVRLEEGELDGFGFGILDLNVEFTPEEVRLAEGSVGYIDHDGGEVGLTGTLGLGPGLPLDVYADVHHLDLHKLMAQLDVTPDSVAHWELAGGFRLQGTCDPLAIEGPIHALSKRFYVTAGAWHDPSAATIIATPQGRVRGRVRVDDHSLNFEQLHAELPHSDFTVDLSIGFANTIDLHAESDRLDLRDVEHLVDMDLAGKGGFTLDVVGRTDDVPALTGRLDLHDFALAEHPIGNLSTRAIMEKDGMAVRFENVAVEKGGSRYVVEDLLLDFSEAFTVDASGRFDRLVLTDLYDTLRYDDPGLHADWQGSVHGTAKVRYTLGFPGDLPNGTLTIEPDVRFEHANLLGVAFDSGALRGALKLRDPSRPYETAALALDQLYLRKRGGSVHVRGQVDDTGQVRLTALGEHLPLLHTEPFQDVAPGLSGEYSLIGRIGGTLEAPRTHMDLTLTGVAYNDHMLGDARVYVRATDQRDPWVAAAGALGAGAPPGDERCARGRQRLLHANWSTGDGRSASGYIVCGGGLDGHVDLDLVIGRAEGWPIRGRVDLLGVPLATLWPRRRAGQTPITGSLRGSLVLEDGILSDVDSLVGMAEVSQVSLAQGSGWVRNDGPVRIALTPQGFTVERARFRGQGSGVSVAGSGSMADGVAGSVRGRMDMATIATLVDGVESSQGLLDVDVKVAGHLSDPVVHGSASLDGGSLKLRSLPYPLERVRAQLSFSARQLLLEEMTARVAGGVVRLRGSASFRDNALSRYELFVDGQDFSLEPMTGVRLGFSTNAKLLWTEETRLPKLSGTVRVSQLVYTRPVQLDLSERLTQQITGTRRAAAEAYDPDKDLVALDIRVVDDGPLRIKNNLMNAQLRIADSDQPFQIVGTDQRVGVLGVLRLTRGNLRFRNTEFDIETGEVTFTDERSIAPRFDVRARTEIKRTGDVSATRWQIQLHAVGDAEDLRLDMSSEPALAEEDIALLLTVGMTRAEAERLQAGDLGSSAALEALATVTGVDREVKKALPVIDDFRVSSRFSPRTNRTEPTITVGKNLTDSVRATATTGIGEDANFRTGVEWRLNDQTSVEAAYDNLSTATSGTFGNVGVDLRWRLEFD